MKSLRKSIYFISFPLSFIGFIFPIYASSMGINVIEIGYLYSIFSIVSIAIRPLVGNLIDKKGRKVGILIGMFFYVIVNCFFIVGDSFKYLLIGRILQSMAASFLWISVDTYISDISDKTNRGKNFGYKNEIATRGQMMGSSIGLTILFNNFTNNPFKLVFIIFLITSLIGFYHGIKTVPETIHLKKEEEEGKIKDKKGLRKFLVTIGIISFITSLTAPIYLLYLQDNISSDLSLITFLFVPGSILSMFLPQKFGSISDKYGREKIIIVGLFLSAIFQIFIPFSKSYYGFMILYTIISLVGMFYGPSFSSIIIDFVGEEKRGKSYGLYSLATGIGGAIGPIVGAFIYENIGDNIVFYTKGSLLIAMTILICYIYIRQWSKIKLEKEPRINLGGK